MIALTAPISGYVEEESENILVIAISESQALGIKEDGQVAWFLLDDIKLDFRYDHGGLGWVDVSGVANAEEETDDGSSEVPGLLSEADGAGDGDPGDEDNRGPGDVDPGETGDPA